MQYKSPFEYFFEYAVQMTSFFEYASFIRLGPGPLEHKYREKL